MNPKLPEGPAAVLAALRVSEPSTAGLAQLTPDDLEWAHRNMLGLALFHSAADALPAGLRAELAGCAGRNRERIRRVREIYSEIDARFTAAGIPWIALKGITQSPLFGAAADERPQYDIDLYVPPAFAEAARDILLEMDYEPIGGMEAFPTDHLPAMVRKTGWQWRGDYFDLDLPFAIEIHVRFWNPELERLPAHAIEEFWDRRERRETGGIQLPALAPADALGYAALHFLKHVLQGSVRAYHALEIARFLEARAGDAAFWREWTALHSPALRRLETVAFRFAQTWFGCALPPEADPLPPEIDSWFDAFSLSPLLREFHANKDELWLHLCLVESTPDRWRVARRRLLPMRLPGPVSDVCVPDAEMTPWRRAAQQARRLRFAAGRARHHAAALPRVAASGARWWLGRQFWIFLGAAALLNFGLFIFTLLYNLWLLGLGFREDFLGTVSSVSTVGTMAGTLPAAWLLRRCGLRRTFLAIIASSAAIIALRAEARAPTLLLVLAAAWGLVFAVWAVTIAPAIAAIVTENRRPAAFSAFFGCMVAVGVVGNSLGGHLPDLLHNTRTALLLGAAVVLLALVPAWRFAPGAEMSVPGSRIWPRGSFLKRYLPGYAVWQLATGIFNPFANVYFTRLGFSAAHIGELFSGSQVVQVATMAVAPILIRRAGLLRAICWTMAATALGLGGLAAGAAPVLAYGWYMSLQFMSEPGINTLLMNRVKPEERSAASSLNYLVAFGMQAVAAYAAGHLFTAWGYAPALTIGGALALAAAGLFAWLM